MIKKKDEIYKIFKNLKIKEEFIIIHSDIVGLVFEHFSMQSFWELIFDGIGQKKTYILPTFTFSRGKTWNYYDSKSDVGILSEYFRTNVASLRTIHPIHSVSIFGKRSAELPKHTSSSSFGKGSIWEWLCKNKSTCNLSLGVKLEGGASICHYPEELLGVDYREYISIKDEVLGPKKKIIDKKFTYFARKINKHEEGINNWLKCEKDLLNSKILRRKYYFQNKYPISLMNTYEATNFIIQKLNRNPYYVGKLTKKL